MVPQKQAEEAIVASQNEGEGGDQEEVTAGEDHVAGAQQGFSLKRILWHGGSVWDAWFSCASNQVISYMSCPLKIKIEIVIFCLFS